MYSKTRSYSTPREVSARRALVLLLGIALSATFHSQAQTPAVPDAAAALSQMVAATGWVPAATPLDAVVSGIIIRHFQSGDVSADFSMKLRGASQYRYSESASKALVVVNGNAGAIVTAGGQARRLPVASALSMRGFVLPMMSFIPNWGAPTVERIVLGTNTISGQLCTGVSLTPKDAGKDPLAALRATLAPVTLWIAGSTGLPARIEYFRAAADNHYATHRTSIILSDYRKVDGLAVPFRQDELIDELPVISLQLTSVQFNAGLTDADFAVAPVLGGAQ